MDVANLSTGQSLMLSEKLFNKVTEIINQLLVSTGAKTVLFCESNGYAVTQVGAVREFDLHALSSLAANNFSATAKMAGMLGEDDSFKYLYHEGEKASLYISNIGFNFILIVIFEVDVALGIIRIFTKKAIVELAKELQKAQDEGEQTRQLLDKEFKSLLSQELDRSLKF